MTISSKTGTIVLSLFFLFCTIGFSIGQAFVPVQIVPDEKNKKVDIIIGGKAFTSYIYPDDLDKPVLFPMYTSNGTVITRGFPRQTRPGERVDHPHHVGLWFNYGDVNGLDFWNNSYAIPADKKDKFGSVRHQRIVKAQGGKDKGTLVVETHWVDSKNIVLLVEETTFVFRGTPTARYIDRTTKLTAKQKVVFTDNKEGMMGLRMDRAFEEPSNKPEVYTDANGNPTTVAALNNEGVNGVYKNSNGVMKGEVWGKRANWVTLSAKKGNEEITIAMFDHKKNVGYPAHWHARGYGLFAVNNLGSKVYVPSDPEAVNTLETGNTMVFKHLIMVKTGGFLSDGDANQEFQSFNR